MTPILLIFFGVPPTAAIATDLWFAAITKLVGARVHHMRGSVDWHVAKLLWLGSLPMAALIVGMVGWGVAAAKVAWLTKAIGVVVLIAAIGLLCAPQLLAYARVRGIGRADRFRLRSRLDRLVWGGAGFVCGIDVGGRRCTG